MSDETLPGTDISICIDESADVGIVVTALQVVEPGFSVSIVVIAVFLSNNIQ